MSEKHTWPEFVGKSADEAIAAIQKAYPSKRAVLVKVRSQMLFALSKN